MIDITSVGTDLGVLDTQVPRAGNILNVQIESLEYAKDFGIDLRFFLREDFQVQNESFKAYLIERLVNYGINLKSVTESVETLFTNLTFNIGADQVNTSLVAR
jgi:hypothetical protein